MARGRGTLMAKLNVASAYRNNVVHLQDRYLLGMRWHDSFFVDLALPFGLCSVPFIFTAIADIVEWMLVNNHGVDFLRYYLDDFTLGLPASSVCSDNLRSCIQLGSELGLPLNPDKLEGPSTCLIILDQTQSHSRHGCPRTNGFGSFRCWKCGPLSRSANGGNWNRLLVTYTMPARLLLKGGLSFAE